MIQDKSMLVDLTIRRWTATKHDKSVSHEVERNHSAHDAGRYNKRLIEKSHLAAIETAANMLRRFHYAKTLPWTDKGQRLLPSALFMDYSRELRALRDEFDRLVRDFIATYPQLVQDAQRRLNTLYQPEDYPPTNELNRLFGVDVEFMPVPQADDFRVDVAEEIQEEIRLQITESIAQRQKDLVADCWERVRDLATRVQQQCSSESPIIRETLVSSMTEMPKLLDGLNIMNDPKLTEAAAIMRTSFDVDADELRKYRNRRARCAEAAQEILAMVP